MRAGSLLLTRHPWGLPQNGVVDPFVEGQKETPAPTAEPPDVWEEPELTWVLNKKE